MRRCFVLFVAAAALVSTATLSAHDNFRIIGTVTKVDATSISVKDKDSRTISIQMDKQTAVTRDKKKVAVSELKVGQSVVVDAYGDSEDDLLALDIRIVPPIAPKK